MGARGRDQHTGCCTELQPDVDGRCLLSELLLMHPQKPLCVTWVCLPPIAP